ncbi:MAG: nuclear transport factor 2 family protein [Crocinitomicaceae bacterium]|nr:nuclear transport factor 2 family protein [Crocinitomicaceae bacterium]
MKSVLLSLLLISSSCFGQVDQLNILIDNWHLAATTADLQKYSQVMSEKFVFLGTAPGERWNKNAFLDFSKPYFDKGKAWDFKPSNRIWEFNTDSTVAWFDENLDTWMRGCRGSGILQKENNAWKISYYNLTVLIENEKIGPFIQLRDQK